MLVKESTYSGFRLKEITQIKEIDSMLYFFEHIKTKADLVFLSNKDENKVFSIAFKTPVSDNTGVAHILEHSVLNGSKKYPLKEPFVELLKGSLKTFLNAMTYPDKTIYPVASTNDKDFLNLMDVYLDGVLNPRIYENEFVFMQEGWHFHLEKPEDDIKLNGVVYNEMKGAYSNPDEILIDTIFETLYSDTTYKYSSGGMPEEITALTYKDFIDFHKMYYHPSNSIIYFYGDLDIVKYLSYLDSNYLSCYNANTKIDNIPRQIKKPAKEEIIKFYPITMQEDESEKEIYNISYNIGCANDPLLRMSFEILSKLLVNYPSSPLRLAFNDAKIGKEIEGHYETDLYYYTLMFIGRDMKEGGHKTFFELINNTLSNLAANKIDKDLIDAAINMYEFSIKDVDNSTVPKGLNYNIDILDSLIYGGNAESIIAYKENLDKIKAQAHSGYFESLIEKYILSSESKTCIVLKPKKGISEAKEEQIKNLLKEKKEKMANEEIAKIIEKTNKLAQIQNTPDTKENIKKIPVLPISDIENPPKRDFDKNGNIYIYNDSTQDIIYLTVYYDIRDMDISKYHYTNFLCTCLTETATKNYSFEKLSNAIKINTGGIDFDAAVSKHLRTGAPRPQITANIRFFNEKREKAMELLDEIMYNSVFADKKRIYEILAKELMQEKSRIIYGARNVIVNRLNSYISLSGALSEYMCGLEYYDFLDDFYRNFDIKYEKIIAEINELYQHIFTHSNVELLLALDKKYNDEILSFIENRFKECENNETKTDIAFSFEAKNEALIMSTDVAYNGRAYDFKKAGYEYDGVLQVIKTIMQTDYLWNNVRVKGGAYGAFFIVERAGGMFVSSYRDPHIKRTYDVYDNIGPYLKETAFDNDAVHKFIIGTISSTDMPLPPPSVAKREYNAYKSGISYEDRIKTREQILSVTPQKIRSASDMFLSLKKEQDYFCTIASKSAVDKNKELFRNIKYLIK